ncbi:conserved Plasmodium protein, unknown function [Plasmodium gaboni]|uniref:RAP protein n=1 Tax=Plasmodium gaboni TaxID=647221 RepID=A0ABY1UTJ7_9APIC|nr:conserved Plasmodium protein, unknown function [Plasmodium gaboni]
MIKCKGNIFFVLKGRFNKRLIKKCEKTYMHTINNPSVDFPYKCQNKPKEGEEFFFNKEKFVNFENVNVKNLNNREFLYYIGYCSKNKLLNLNKINCVMKELEIKIINSINNSISSDFSQNKKNILNSKCYNQNNEKPFFDIHDLVKVYLNICYINSYYFLKEKRENNNTIKYKNNIVKDEENNIFLHKQNKYTQNGTVQNMNIKNNHKIGNVKNEFEINNKPFNNKIDFNTNIIDFFKNDQNVYNNSCNSSLDSSKEYVCNEYVKNIFNLLSIYFLQNIDLINNHYLCRLFYGYNKSKFSNHRYLNNLCFEIIKRIKKIRTYHLYLMLTNCYYLNYVDSVFIKILLLNIITKFSQLPCEAMCQVIPVIPLYINSEKLIYKINLIYSKKIASFNQIGHIILLFKKMLQYNIISQKNVFLSFKHLNNFIKLKKKNKINNTNTINTINNINKDSKKEQEMLNEKNDSDDHIINKVVESFENFEHNEDQFFEKKKNKDDIIINQNQINSLFQNNNISNNNIQINHKGKYKNSKCNIQSENINVNVTKKLYMNKMSNVKQKSEEIIFQNDDFIFNFKIIEMHLKHDLKNIYSLLPNEYKNFLERIRKISCNLNKNIQGEKEIFILKKYMKMLQYKFITFNYGPYVLHICDPFYKIFLQFENQWKLYPIYEQIVQKNFEMNKINHLKKEGFKPIFICHDILLECNNENEKLEYINSILLRTQFTKYNITLKEKQNLSIPQELQYIHI